MKLPGLRLPVGDSAKNALWELTVVGDGGQEVACRPDFPFRQAHPREVPTRGNFCVTNKLC